MKRTKPYIKSFVSFSIFLTIVLLQCEPYLAQVCSVSCTQTAIVRNRPYEEAFEIVQNREWEDEDDFGDDLGDLILRHIRVKRPAPGYSPSNFVLYTRLKNPHSLEVQTAHCTQRPKMSPPAQLPPIFWFQFS